MYAASDLDWGTVPAWFGSVLTGGSLLLGFSILARDKRNEKSEQAQQIACWGNLVPNSPLSAANKGEHSEDNHTKYVVGVRNTSTAPIFRPHIIVRPLKLREFRRREDKRVGKLTVGKLPGDGPMDYRRVYSFEEGEYGLVTPVMVPNQTLEKTIDLGSFPLHWSVRVLFGDKNGQYWTRDVRTGELRRASRSAAFER